MASFYVVAKYETGNWDSEWLAAHGIRAAFGLYLIKEGEGTHLCELTPSSRADWVQNAFILTDEARALQDVCYYDREPGQNQIVSEREDAEYDNGGESTSYFRFFDPEKADSRFFALLGDPVAECPDDCTDAESEWDRAREWQATNPVEPGILWDATFAEWQAEQSAKRRAEMRPPCTGPEPLPLFMAAALPMQRAIMARFGLDVDNLNGAEWETMRAADNATEAEFRALAWL